MQLGWGSRIHRPVVNNNAVLPWLELPQCICCGFPQCIGSFESVSHNMTCCVSHSATWFAVQDGGAYNRERRITEGTWVAGVTEIIMHRKLAANHKWFCAHNVQRWGMCLPTTSGICLLWPRDKNNCFEGKQQSCCSGPPCQWLLAINGSNFEALKGDTNDLVSR